MLVSAAEVGRTLVTCGKRDTVRLCWSGWKVWASLMVTKARIHRVVPGLAQCILALVIMSDAQTFHPLQHGLTVSRFPHVTKVRPTSAADTNMEESLTISTKQTFLVCWRSLCPPHIWFISLYLVESTCIHFVLNTGFALPLASGRFGSAGDAQNVSGSHSVYSRFGHHEWRSDFPPTPT